jgi:hypothetical protein
VELREKGFQLEHHCSMQASLFYEGFLQGTLVKLWVTTWLGLARVDLVLSIGAAKATQFPEGVVLVIKADGLREIQQSETRGALDGSEVRCLDWDSESALYLRFTESESVVIRSPQGCEAPKSIDWDPGVGEMRVAWLSSGLALQPGEGRLLRLAIQNNQIPQDYALVVGSNWRKRSPQIAAMGRESLIHRRTSELTQSFLLDPKRGLLRSGEGAGDYHFSLSEFGNLEYDTTLGLTTYAAAHLDHRAFASAKAAADHLISYDRDALGSGLFFPHGRGHRKSDVELGHHWIDGLCLLHQATRDPTYEAAIADLSNALPKWVLKLDLKRELPRSLGWGLLALTCQIEQRNDKREALLALSRLRSFIVKSQTRSGWLSLQRRGHAEESFEVGPYVQSGIILPALAHSLRVAADRHAREAVSLLIEATLTDAIRFDKDRGRTFVATRLLCRSTDGKCLRAFGEAKDEQVALILAGLSQARPEVLGGEPCAGLLGNLGENLHADQKQFIGSEVSILLRSISWL